MEPKRSYSLKETGVLSRQKIQPISGIAVHRIMHLTLIRRGKWELLCAMVKHLNQNHVSVCWGIVLRMTHVSSLAWTLCSPALLYGFILSRSSMCKLLGDGTGRAGLESGKGNIFSPLFLAWHSWWILQRMEMWSLSVNTKVGFNQFISTLNEDLLSPRR